MQLNKLMLLFLLPLLMVACRKAPTLFNPSTIPLHLDLVPQDTLILTVSANDLSEDMSVFSSKNDEILVLIYEYQDSVLLESPLLATQLQFDEIKHTDQVTFSLDKSVVGGALLFVLIEQDSETPIEQIDPVIRLQHPQIIEAFEDGDYLKLEKYLGDEDLLGIRSISKMMGNSMIIEFNGIHKLDKYDYILTLTVHSKGENNSPKN